VRRYVALGEIGAGDDRPVCPEAPGEEPTKLGERLPSDYSWIYCTAKKGGWGYLRQPLMAFLRPAVRPAAHAVDGRRR